MSDTKFKTKVVDEVPPVRRTTSGSKYDYVFEDARKAKTKKISVNIGDRDKASSVAAYLKRVSDEEEFEITQRLDEVYVEYLA